MLFHHAKFVCSLSGNEQTIVKLGIEIVGPQDGLNGLAIPEYLCICVFGV